MKLENITASVLFRLFTLNNEHIYGLCQKYVNHYRNENNANIQENGELRVIQNILPDCVTVFDVGANVGNWATIA